MAEGPGGVDLATLGLRIDAREAKEAVTVLGQLTEAGARTEAQTKRLEGSTRAYRDAQRLTVQDIQAASRAYDEAHGGVEALNRAHAEAIRWNQFYTAQERDKVRAMKDAHAEALLMNQAFDRANAVVPRTTGGIGRLNNALIVMTRNAVGANAVTGQLTDVLGTYALGVGRMTAILAGIAALAGAWALVTKEARDAKKEQEEALKALEELQRRRSQGPAGDVPAQTASARDVANQLAQEIADLEALRVRQIDRGITGDAAAIAQARLEAKRREYEQVISVVQSGEAEIAEVEREEAEQARREREQRARERIRAEEEAARERERLAREQLRRDMDATKELAANAEQARAFREQFASEQEAEKVRLFTAARQKATEADREAARAAREGERAERERQQAIQDSVREMEAYAFSIFQVVDALGLLGSGGARIGGAVQIGTTLRALQQGAITGGDAALGIGGGVTQVVSAIVESGERQREAMRRLTDSMDRLRVDVFASPRDARDAFQGVRGDIAGLGTFVHPRERARLLLDAQEALDSAIARTTELYRGELEVRRLLASGQDEEAARLRIQIQQERELAEARAAGWDAQTIATLEGVQAAERAAAEEERLAEARRKAEEAAKRERAVFEDLTTRALGLLGRNDAAARAGLFFRQQRELEGASGLPSDLRNLMEMVHVLERIQLETERQTRLAEEQLHAAQEQIRVQEQTVSTLSRTVESLSRFQSGLSLGPLSPLSPTRQLEEARRQFQIMRDLALGGDVTAAQSLPDAVRALLEASRAVNASGSGFVGDFQVAQEVLEQVRANFAGQLTIEEQTLASLRAQEQAAIDQIALIRENHEAAMAQWATMIERLVEQIAETRGLRTDWENYATDSGTPGLPGDFDFTFADTITQAHDEAQEAREALVRATSAGFTEQIDATREQTDEVVRRLDRIELALAGERQ